MTEALRRIAVSTRRAIEVYYHNHDFVTTYQILITTLKQIRQLPISDPQQPESKSAAVLTYEMMVASTTTANDGCNGNDTWSQNTTRIGTYSVRPRSSVSLTDISQAESHHNKLQSSIESDDIYDGAFLLTGNIPAQLHETTAVLLFNLALVHHKLGLANNGKFLPKTLQLYQQVIAVLHASDYIQSCWELQVMMAAAYHNVGQIYLVSPLYSGNRELATEMFQNVQMIIVAVQEKLGSDIATTTNSFSNPAEDINFFCCSLYYAQLSIQNGHAAAA
jgi:hypothetical protein